MATYNKFQDFVEQLGLAKHNLNADQLNCYLSNTVPSAAGDAVKADLAEITAGNGYSADGMDVTNTYAESGGIGTITGSKITWTAGPAAMATFQYVVLMNFTQSSPLKPLLGWWDYGAPLTLQNGETFSVKFNGQETTGSILTIE